MFVSIKKILPLTAKRLGISQEIELKEICLYWKMILNEIFDQEKEKLKKVYPISLKNKILFISCPNTIWASELQMRRDEIIKKINQKLGEEKIKKIRFVY